jgi:hypothetical protein
MNRRFRKQLETQYQQKTDSCCLKALHGSTNAELKDEIEELETYSKLLQFREPTLTPDSGLALAVALVCISVASFLRALD